MHIPVYDHDTICNIDTSVRISNAVHVMNNAGKSNLTYKTLYIKFNVFIAVGSSCLLYTIQFP